MSQPITLTDENLDSVLNGTKPALILITNGDGVRSDFKISFNKMAGESGSTVFATIDPSSNPEAAAKFGGGDKPVLVAWYCGEEVARRPKPWGTDLQLALELLQNAVKENPTEPAPAIDDELQETSPLPILILDKPVNVTDSTFEQEVLDASTEMAVLVDYWAAWCGPCRSVAPILDKLAKEFAGKIKIAKVDVDANPRLSATFQIRSIPNLMIVKNRKIIFNQPGALLEPSLRDLVEQAIKLEVPLPQQKPPLPQ